MDGLIRNFWQNLESNFQTSYIIENITTLLNVELEDLPEFFITHFKKKIAKELIDQIYQFKLHFVTATEEDWVQFIRDERVKLETVEKKLAYKPETLRMDVLKAVPDTEEKSQSIHLRAFLYEFKAFLYWAYGTKENQIFNGKSELQLISKITKTDLSQYKQSLCNGCHAC